MRNVPRRTRTRTWSRKKILILLRNLKRPSRGATRLHIPKSLSTRIHQTGKVYYQERSKNFQLVYGVLHYKGKGGSLRNCCVFAMAFALHKLLGNNLEG